MKRPRVPIDVPPFESERFWSKVSVSGKDDCWNWIGAESRKRPLGFYYSTAAKRSYGATRVAFFFFLCDPGALEVCHRCDNPICCNPNHLFLGSHKTNMADCISKGRFIAPLGKITRVLTAEEREQVVHLLGTMTYQQVADKFEVSFALVNKIIVEYRRQRGTLGPPAIRREQTEVLE